ncbi:hypothetical protein GCM10009122_29370 [Fulvivirga kasyanovii]|uniref:Uncharacterized protein n=1 Tax=Fulvivirga kasyanovii TaxID=396812 RepID=A0ABW9RLE6_9BACT|nr:hypothetical protein [Fulvivirga kasyanovii]MTI24937.1 hypothetical protein [Fulvivirga kasyanovii]
MGQPLFRQSFNRSDFTYAEPPEKGSPAWYELNYAQGFSVNTENRSLQINEVEPKRPAAWDLDHGKLRGIDHGEWDGRLEFIFRDPSKEPVLIKTGNIKFVFRFRQQIFFIEGLAHLGYNQGAMFRLKCLADTFEYEKVCDFEDAPQAILVKDDKIFIASYSGFYIVDDSFEKKVLIKDAFWGGLYPNSIAVVGDKLYIGIRGGYIQLDVDDKAFKLFKFKPVH